MRLRWVLALTLGVAMVVAVSTWAVLTVFDEPDEVLQSTPSTFIEVADGEVGASIDLNTVAEWSPIPVGRNGASGTVTSIAVQPGQEVEPGSVLYTVNLRPVVIAQGEVPAFRALASGASGADVTQLQSFMTALGRYSGPLDGRFGTGLTSAVRGWQKELGVEQTGSVESGDVVFVPTLPTRVALDAEVVTLGAPLVGGEPVISGLPVSPGFIVPVTETQAGLMPAGTRVEITSPSGAIWEAVAGEQRTNAEGTIEVQLIGRDDAVICGDACAEVPVTEPTLLASKVVTVETVTGLVVPSAALRADADGGNSVIDEQGRDYPVEVITSARGQSVIEGVDAGLRVRVPVTDE